MIFAFQGAFRKLAKIAQALFRKMRPGPLSFGVELECLVAYILDDGRDPDAPSEQRTLFRVASKDFPDSEWIIRSEVLKTMAQYGAPMAPIQDGPLAVSWAERSLYRGDYSKWHVRPDSTVHEPNLELGYLWSNIEIASMATWAAPSGYRHIQQVVTFLKDNHRLRLNPSAGLHVHIGNGKEPFPDKVIVKLAALLWAADGVLSHLHPPERCFAWAQSIRQATPLAAGEFVQAVSPGNAASGSARASSLANWARMKEEIRKVHGSVEQSVRGGRAATSAPDKNVSSEPVSSHPSRKRLPGRRLNPFDDPEAMKRQKIYNPRDIPIQEDFSAIPNVSTVEEGVKHILNCQEGDRVADLLTRNYSRLNYNFKPYSNDMGRKPLKTIEFREATGSLDPKWITIWIRICVGLVAFARDASKDDLNVVIDKLAHAEKCPVDHPDYDVVDFLLDIGLHEEADFVRERVLVDRHAFWFPSAGEHGINVPPATSGDRAARDKGVLTIPPTLDESPVYDTNPRKK